MVTNIKVTIKANGEMWEWKGSVTNYVSFLEGIVHDLANIQKDIYAIGFEGLSLFFYKPEGLSIQVDKV